MFLSTTRIEKNKAAGLGVAGRRMRPQTATPFEQQTLSGVRIVARLEPASRPRTLRQRSPGAHSPAVGSARKNAA